MKMSAVPVIMSDSLRQMDICRHFGGMSNVKLRMSSTVQEDICIFPRSSLAFFLIHNPSHINLHRIRRFLDVHRSSYVLIQWQQWSYDLTQAIHTLQSRLFPDMCPLLLANGSDEAAQLMLSTANAHLASTSALSSAAIDGFRDRAASQPLAEAILMSAGLEAAEQLGGQSMASIASATKQQLIGCGLDQFKATQLIQFFHQDYYPDY